MFKEFKTPSKTPKKRFTLKSGQGNKNEDLQNGSSPKNFKALKKTPRKRTSSKAGADNEASKAVTKNDDPNDESFATPKKQKIDQVQNLDSGKDDSICSGWCTGAGIVGTGGGIGSCASPNIFETR